MPDQICDKEGFAAGILALGVRRIVSMLEADIGVGGFASQEPFMRSLGDVVKELDLPVVARGRFKGLEAKRSVPWEEAVGDWYDTLYLPTVGEIRDHRILHSFPGRTAADLYLWVMDHRYYLSKALGHDVGAEEAVYSYQEKFKQRPFERLLAWFKNIFGLSRSKEEGG